MPITKTAGTKTAGTDRYQRVFEEGAEVVGYSTQALGAMALLAHRYGDDRGALRTLRLAFGRDARPMARAVDYFPERFNTAAMRGAIPGELLSLFALAKLPRPRALALYERTRGFVSNYFEVQAMIDAEEEKARQKVKAAPGAVKLRNVNLRPQRVSQAKVWVVTLRIPFGDGVAQALEAARGNANVRIVAARKMGRPRKEARTSHAS